MLTGYEAIEYASCNGLSLNKYADPIEGARNGLTVGEAREIAATDPSLIYVEPTLTQVETGNAEPDLFRDAEGRAYWSDGSPVTAEECETLEDADVLRDVIERNGLKVTR